MASVAYAEPSGARSNGRGPALSIDVSQVKGRLTTSASDLRAQQLAIQAQNALEEAHARVDPRHGLDEEGSQGSSGDEAVERLHERDDGHEELDGEAVDDMDDSGSFSDSLSSSPSIPDEDIDFALVYALHVFLATVDGQASVVKGDKLLLLDDSNSYWWLVRVLKSQAVGYIPAENIETPFERLARLNKHRNVDLTSATQDDHITGPMSTTAQHRFQTRIPPSQQPHPHRSQHPSAMGVIADPSHKDHPRNISPVLDRPQSRKGKVVIFTAPTYYEHSANGESDDYGDEMEGDEAMMGEQHFEDENDEESDFSDENQAGDDVQEGAARGVHVRRVDAHHAHLEDVGDDGGDEEELSAEQWEEERARSLAAQQAQQDQWRVQQDRRPLSPQQQQSLDLQQQQYAQQRGISPSQQQELAANPQYQPNQLLHQQQQLIQQQHQQRAANSLQRQPNDRRPSDASVRSLRSLPELEDDDFDENAPTKKLSATPPIVRDLSFDMDNPFADLPGGVRSPSPMRVRGVEVVDPKDPRYGKLITERRPDQMDIPLEGETSLTSIESAGAEEERRQTQTGGNGKLQRKPSRDTGDAAGEKKRKGGGILSGLFRKKDKKKKADKDESEQRSPEEAPRAATSFGQKVLNGDYTPDSPNERLNKRGSQTAESMFSTESALRQQQVEAKAAMFHQYGVQRGPDDVSNTMTPRATLLQQQSLAPSAGTPQRLRPGSLIGSPSIPGLDVPLLSVLRVFAGDNIDSDATFKTVLLNRATLSSELVKQAMQRFQLAGLELQEEYYLTVRELGGEERELVEGDHPLVIFEALSDSAGNPGFAIPSVNRSSIGSISSIASNLSLNPAITRLGMNDFSDDSAVKFYLNRKQPLHEVSMLPTVAPAASELGTPTAPFSPTPSFRFAIRLLIHASDLPENVVFDPSSNAIVPRSVVLERQQRSGVEMRRTSTGPRERIVFFPKNVTVSEVVEAGLDRFGIVDGVVDGGDEVEDRVSRRRSVSRVKYGLAVDRAGQETLLNASSKLLDAYSTAPLFKPYDRTSKEFRRRSVDATLILGAADDVQPSDPVFIIRRAVATPHGSGAAMAPGPVPIAVDELAVQQQSMRGLIEPRPLLAERSATASSFNPSVYETPSEELGAFFTPSTSITALPNSLTSPSKSVSTPADTPTRHSIITAQRAATRANQHAILSASKNEERGVDINLERGTIRSSRSYEGEGRVRYSYIDPEGSVRDISDIVEREWESSDSHSPTHSRTVSHGRGRGDDEEGEPRAASVMSRIDGSTDGTESFLSALTSPVSGTMRAGEEDEDEEDRQAIDALRATPLQVDNTSRQASSLQPTPFASRSDLLSDALGSGSPSSPTIPESLQERLDRVLAKVRDDKSRAGSSGRPGSRSRTISGRDREFDGATRSLSPLSEGQVSPTFSGLEGRFTPIGEGRDSPSIDQLVSTGSRSGSTRSRHGQKASISSLNSSHSRTNSSDLHSSNVTPASSTFLSASSRPTPPIVYQENFGLEILMSLVDSRAAPLKPRQPQEAHDKAVHGLFGRELPQDGWEDEGVRAVYEDGSKRYGAIEQRLDALLSQMVR